MFESVTRCLPLLFRPHVDLFAAAAVTAAAAALGAAGVSGRSSSPGSPRHCESRRADCGTGSMLSISFATGPSREIIEEPGVSPNAAAASWPVAEYLCSVPNQQRESGYNKKKSECFHTILQTAREQLGEEHTHDGRYSLRTTFSAKPRATSYSACQVARGLRQGPCVPV